MSAARFVLTCALQATVVATLLWATSPRALAQEVDAPRLAVIRAAKEAGYTNTAVARFEIQDPAYRGQTLRLVNNEGDELQVWEVDGDFAGAMHHTVVTVAILADGGISDVRSCVAVVDVA